MRLSTYPSIPSQPLTYILLTHPFTHIHLPTSTLYPFIHPIQVRYEGEDTVSARPKDKGSDKAQRSRSSDYDTTVTPGERNKRTNVNSAASQGSGKG